MRRTAGRKATVCVAMADAADAVAPFEFASAGRIIFGRGEALKRTPGAVKDFGVCATK